MAEKTYVGKGWQKTFKNGRSVINISINRDALNGLEPDQYGNISLVVGGRKEVDAKSKATHWVAIDDYRHAT